MLAAYVVVIYFECNFNSLSKTEILRMLSMILYSYFAILTCILLTSKRIQTVSGPGRFGHVTKMVTCITVSVPNDRRFGPAR